MTLGEIFRDTYLKLKQAGVELPHLEAGWILEKYVNIDALQRIKTPELLIHEDVVAQISQAITQRETGEPLAYIFGEREFYSRIFQVNKNVLIPRPETEQLVDWALKWVEKNKPNQPIEILDLGTGSGCLGLTILKEIPESKLTALDISKEALAVAKQNSEQLNIAERVEFINLDAAKTSHLLNRFDLVVANPPYIAEGDNSIELNVKLYEPHIALFSAENGLAKIKAWLQAIPHILKEKSAVGFEIGSQQGADVLALFQEQKVFTKIYGIKDYSDHDRFVCGEKN